MRHTPGSARAAPSCRGLDIRDAVCRTRASRRQVSLLNREKIENALPTSWPGIMALTLPIWDGPPVFAVPEDGLYSTADG